MAHKLAGISLILVSAILSQPAFAQRGGGGGGHCGGGTQSSSNTASSFSPYTQNSLGNPYVLQQMQQQYAQQAMAMRQMYALQQMENQMLRNQLMQVQKNAQLAQAPVDANGDSNVLLSSKKNTATAAKNKSRTVTKRDKSRATDKAVAKANADDLAMNDFK